MKWIEPEPVEVSPEILELIGGHQLLAQTLVRRGLVTPDQICGFLEAETYHPANPGDLPDLAKAVALLHAAIEKKTKILIWGDFDVDGQTATALLYDLILSLGGDVRYNLPVRARESHGVNLERLKAFLDEGTGLVLTCDTGINAADAVDLAREYGAEFVITDHHDLPEKIPDAAAVVNPRFLPRDHPFSGLPGVGVAYEFALELLRSFGREREAGRYLDLVALGIVADVAVVTADVRYLLQKGLEQLRQPERPGIQAILERVELDAQGITEDHIGFLIAPRLNSLGRLADANLAVELLTTQDLGAARLLVQQLETLNIRRRTITNQVFQAAMTQIRANPWILSQPVIILEHDSWPGGVTGIVASRLAERYGKPSVLISTGEGEIARGSARSVEGINIAQVLAASGDLLSASGGHPMAAGFGIQKERIPELISYLTSSIAKLGVPEEPFLEVDGRLPLAEASLELAEDMERLAPYGPGNLPLVLVSPKMRIKSYSALGREEEHLQLRLEDAQGLVHRVLWWQGAGWPLPEGEFDLAYRLRSNTDRGSRKLTFEWVDFRGQEEKEVRPKIKPLKVIDYRNEAHPLQLLRILLGQGDIQIWAEGDLVKRLTAAGVTALPRNRLGPCEVLAIWTSPPGPQELAQAIQASVPQRVVLFAVDPQADDTISFLTRLAGLVKYGVKYQEGLLHLSHLAGATAQKVATVQKGLNFMVQHGDIGYEQYAEDQVRIRIPPVEKPDPTAPGEAEIILQLKKSIAETAAYRLYFARSSVAALLSSKD